MSGLSVIGLQWGDEAKGKLVDILAPAHDIVVRYQGGANAGHTIVDGDNVYKLHLLPTGIINESVVNVITPGVVMEPATLLKEIDGVTDRGINVEGRLWMSDRAHVVCPWHIAEDKAMNALLTGSSNIGTTLRGIGPCYRDKVGRSFAIRLGDLYRSDFKDHVAKILDLKKRFLASFNGHAPDDEMELNAIVDQFAGYAERLKPFVRDTTAFLLDAVEKDKRILMEGAQGALLDIDHGTFPFVTSSNSSGVGISTGSGIPSRWIDRMIGVAKAYCTRVGGGPFPTELHDETGEHIREIGHEYGTTTGRPRRCGWFDAVATRYTARLSGVDGVALTMLDVLSQLDEIQICTAYKINGEITKDFPSHSDDLEDVEPVYESIAGWKEDVTQIREYNQLPENAKKFVQRIGELIGRPIEVVSVGPDRVQTIPVGDYFKSQMAAAVN